jgi:hypothetical protein
MDTSKVIRGLVVVVGERVKTQPRFKLKLNQLTLNNATIYQVSHAPKRDTSPPQNILIPL